VGNGMTFPKNLCGPQEIRAGITLLSDQVAARLRGHGMKCCCVSLSVRDPDFRDSSRQKQILSPTNLSREIAQYAWELAQESWNMNNPVRALTVTALTLIPEGQAGAQMDFLGDTDQTLHREKLERLEKYKDRLCGYKLY
jgi:DNA polymerase-4